MTHDHNDGLKTNNNEDKSELFERAFSRTVVSRVTEIFESNPATVRRQLDRAVEVESSVMPHKNDLTLRRLNYSRVDFGRLVERDAAGDIVFPIASTIITFDQDGEEIMTYDITEYSPIDIIVGIEDVTMQDPLGVDRITDTPVAIKQSGLTSDSGFVPGQRELTPQEQLELRSVLDVCRETLRTVS